MENKFVDGLFVNRRENAPDFLKASLSFNERFIDYLKSNFNAKGYCNIDLKESKTGKLYAQLNDWKPEERFVKKEDGSIGVEERDKYVADKMEFPKEEINVDEIPF